jgi:hypothetical protein
MPDPSLRHKLTDIELVEYAQRVAASNPKSLRRITDDDYRDAVIYEDRSTGERRSLPNKFIRSIGVAATFELINPELIPGAPIPEVS